jgi:hypothetical protein
MQLMQERYPCRAAALSAFGFGGSRASWASKFERFAVFMAAAAAAAVSFLMASGDVIPLRAGSLRKAGGKNCLNS